MDERLSDTCVEQQLELRSGHLRSIKAKMECETNVVCLPRPRMQRAWIWLLQIYATLIRFDRWTVRGVKDATVDLSNQRLVGLASDI